MLRKTIFLAAVGLCISSPAQAHRQWFLPSTTILADTNQGVTVEAAASTDPFKPDHRPMRTEAIKVWAPDGTMGAIENAATGNYRSVFDVKIDKPGTWRIGTASDAVSGRFKLGGETWMVGGRRGGPAPANAQGGQPAAPKFIASVAEIPANATELDLTQVANRNEFFVTAGAPTDVVLKPAGKGLEMVPITHPTDLVADEQGKFQFLVDGKPAAGLTVTVVPGGQRFRDAEQSQELTTDADGTVAVSWPVPGYYWLNATASDEKPSAARAAKRRMSYTATLEVLAP